MSTLDHARLVLLGAPGAGKSAVASALADRLDAPLLDTDDLVAEAAGVDPEFAFLDLGEERYRALEAEVAARALTTPGAIVALGSGALGPGDPHSPHGAATRTELARVRESGTHVVDLTVQLATATRRLELTGTQPVGLGAPRALLVRFAQQRAPLYAANADRSLATDAMSIDEVVAEVLGALGESGDDGTLS